jgi:hypothetical protein
MQLGSLTVSGELDGAGNAGVSVRHNPSNRAAENIKVFDAKQGAKRRDLLAAVEDAARDYFEYCNQPTEEVRAASENVQVGVNARDGGMDGDKAKPAAKAPSKKSA